MRVRDMQDEIVRLKKEKGVCVAAHSYQAREILEIADFTGDSYQLSVLAAKATHSTIVMCGVKFMAETVKILSPDKTVLLANPTAGCPMAEQIDKELMLAIRETNPHYTVVAYINTTADLKTVCDVCVTSSSAVKIVNALPSKDILFVPDSNLGAWVARQAPDKNIKLIQGGCPVHEKVSAQDVHDARTACPDALLLVHPECVSDVTTLADFVGATTAIMEYAEKSEHRDFIIGTESSIVENLQYKCPGKRFYPLTKELICPDMKLTTLSDVLCCLKGDGGEEIVLDEETIKAARGCIDKMIELGG
ncbi:MAG: quinolinate synthase NadA [Chitinispirillia bacterium]|nr:quinolinate synthase NadA [Chitinispirillia bacterium]MCL2268396.1 quinolinate synthase NadA [Chitinispirillia bacterium]